jgi:Alpha/beta hydrolase domain
MARARTTTALILTLATLAVTALAGCSSGDDDNSSGETDTGGAVAAVDRPDGPAATLAGPLTAGSGVSLVAGRSVDLAAADFVEEEYTAEGTATSYRADGPLPTDGTFELTEDAAADYRTRIVVRRPAAAADFNGTVVVEWLNVSAGFDSTPDFSYMADELLRGGYAWVGVSAQRIGIEGGPVAVSTGGAADELAGKGIKALDPARYATLSHPGDAFAYDIYTQVARALRSDDGGALGDLEPERLLAVGESQSAFALTTYVNGVQPLTLAYDGFLVHSRGGAAAPLGAPGEGIDIAGTIGGEPTHIRTDLDSPVLIVETETDVVSLLGYYPARQDDSDTVQLWEIAGTAHADAYQVGAGADLISCPVPINAGPQHYVIKAALRSLDAWVRDGTAPPEAPRLEVDDGGGSPAIVRDDDGIALGGIRTPQVDAPTAVLSGDPAGEASIICLLLGSTTPMTPEQLAARYPSPDEYMAAYEEATDAVVEAGFVLDDDRQAMLDEADPSVVPG